MKKATTILVFTTGFTAGAIFTSYKMIKFALETDQIREGIVDYFADKVNNIVFTNDAKRG